MVGEVAGRILGQGAVGVRKPGSVTKADTLGNSTGEPIMSSIIPTLHHTINKLRINNY